MGKIQQDGHLKAVLFHEASYSVHLNGVGRAKPIHEKVADRKSA